MAPALMVAALDAITGGFEAAFRSFVPLVLVLIFALLLAGLMSFVKKKRNSKTLNNKELNNKSKVV